MRAMFEASTLLLFVAPILLITVLYVIMGMAPNSTISK